MAPLFIFIFFILLLLISIPLIGRYMAFIFQENAAPNIFILTKIEQWIYRLCGINSSEEMTWKQYAKCLLYFNGIGLIFLFSLQLLQGWLPLNPQHFAGVEPFLALNTAISFVTNTNWQAYGGENSLSYLTQMTGLTVQNFVSAATGNAVLLVLIRGITRQSSQTIGNFWVDLTKTVTYLLLPLSLILSILLIGQGVIQNFNPYVIAETTHQTIPMGPVASQVAIKQLGTNGGGFFNANSAHPFENPTPFSNFLQTFAILLIPAASVYMYGKLANVKKQAWIILGVMTCLWLSGLTIAGISEQLSNPIVNANPVLEGKETRFGIFNSILWATATTATSNGSVNSMVSSLSPLAGGMALFNILIGEIIFGGVGVGLCSMIMFILMTVFLAGLMVGRTPEYLGKKIEMTEMRWVILAILAPSALILLGATIGSTWSVALESLSQSGPHGLSELLYAFGSAGGNNGSAFAGLNANTLFFNISLGIIMLLARCAILVPSLALGGNLAKKKIGVFSVGSFTTDNLLFGILLFSVILIIAALTFFPALSLGPIAEQILMLNNQSF